jgi:hypothetical protein
VVSAAAPELVARDELRLKWSERDLEIEVSEIRCGSKQSRDQFHRVCLNGYPFKVSVVPTQGRV